MELKEIEEEIQGKFIDFMKKILPDTKLEYFKAIMPKGILIEFIQSFGKEQYNQALEDAIKLTENEPDGYIGYAELDYLKKTIT